MLISGLRANHPRAEVADGTDGERKLPDAGKLSSKPCWSLFTGPQAQSTSLHAQLDSSLLSRSQLGYQVDSLRSELRDKTLENQDLKIRVVKLEVSNSGNNIKVIQSNVIIIN